MKTTPAIALLAIFVSAPVSATTVLASSEATYTFSILSSQVDAFNFIDGSSTAQGTGSYSVMPGSSSSSGGSSSGAGGTATAKWSATADAPPSSSVTVDQAWFPTVDAQGKPLPIYHVYNGTEFAVPMEIQLGFHTLSSGSVTGAAGAAIFDQIAFHIDCTSCTGLSATDFSGGDALQAGAFYGAAGGAFSSSKSNNWVLDFTLNPYSGLGLFTTARSTGTLVTIAEPDAVPEPASWAMMLAGIGTIGGLFRKSRERRVQCVPAE
jgi:hypothetical protein